MAYRKTCMPAMSKLVAAMLSLLAFALLVSPRVALARDYSIDRVDIDATVASDGSLEVTEMREFDFDGSFHGVYWKIPTGSYLGRTIDTTVLAVGEVIDGSFVAFDEGYDGAEHTYEVEERSSYVRVKLYSSHDDERAQFVISYRDTNLATRYLDTSELYWKFVSDGWDVESENVTCTIHLPVPGGQEVMGGDNVRAWGHGPLDASLSFENGDVVYVVPGVGTSEFAEARIAFPAEWLSEARVVGYSQLQTILSEEQQWADEANAQRRRARMMIGGASGVGIALPLATIALALKKRSDYQKAHKTLFDDKYFRDVPTNDHPAVLGALLNGGDPTDECLTASLMRLTDQGNARLDLVKYKEKKFLRGEKVKEDYCLTALSWPQDRDDNASRVDRATMKLVFQELAPLAVSLSGDRDSLYFNHLERIARTHAEKYDRVRKGWTSSVSNECQRRGFFKDEQKTGAGLVIGLGIFNILLAVGGLFVMALLDVPIAVALGISALQIVVGILSIVIGARFQSRSQEALEIVAQLKALKRWLKDFTRLEEAVPQDVILWNRLLVMAVVLGVSEEVIEQLRVAAPHVLEDDALATTYGWYYVRDHSSPSHAFTDAVATAHSVSAGKLAASSDSSGGGGGGGFSGGGGGGFGGGGGGGAF